MRGYLLQLAKTLEFLVHCPLPLVVSDLDQVLSEGFVLLDLLDDCLVDGEVEPCQVDNEWVLLEHPCQELGVVAGTAQKVLGEHSVGNPFKAVEALQSRAVLHDLLESLQLLCLLLQQPASRLQLLHGNREVLVGLYKGVGSIALRLVRCF